MKCQKCGCCCYTKTIELSNQDIAKIKAITNITFYRIRVTGAKVLNWKPYKKTHVCVFFDPENKICTIYDNRPFICRYFFCSKTILF